MLDELAHRNLPGARHATRWQDAGELLAAGIDVISTISIGHLDSFTGVVEKITVSRLSRPCRTRSSAPPVRSNW